MSGTPKFGIYEKDGVEFGGVAEYCPDFTDIQYPDGSTKYTYSGDLLTQIVVYRSATQTDANRIYQEDITYTTELPTTIAQKYYSSTDGTVLLKTVTTTNTFNAACEITGSSTVHT